MPHYITFPSSSAKKAPKSYARKWETCLTLTALVREGTPTHLCLARTQPFLPPLSGGLWGSSAGAGIPPGCVGGPWPTMGLSPAGCQGARRAALAIAAELPALNNGAIEGLELGVRPGWPGCGLWTGRTAEPACSTPAELQPKIGTWWPFRGWASLSGGHGLFACGDFVEYLWLGEGEGRREPGSCVTLFLFVFWC